MDLTELAMLSTGLTGAFGGFFVGLRVCGPRLQTTWTERHPYEIACEVRDGRRPVRALHPRTRNLVARELEAMSTGRPDLVASVPLQLDGVEHRYRNLSAEALAYLSADRTPRRTPVTPVGLRLIPHAQDSAEVIDAEWTEAEPSWPRAA